MDFAAIEQLAKTGYYTGRSATEGLHGYLAFDAASTFSILLLMIRRNSPRS